MVSPDRRARPPAWAVHELDALARLDRARLCLDAVLVGSWPADPAITGAVAELVDTASVRLAWAHRLKACAA